MTRLALLACGFALAAVPARADDAADARKIIDKAVKVHGGQETLDKLSASVIKFKGTFHGMGDGIPMTGEVSVQGSDKQRVELEIDAGGMKIPLVIVVNGDKGWTKIAKDVTEFDKDQAAEAKEQAYAAWVVTLAPLKDKQFTLALVGEAKVGKKAVVGVKVSSKGHRDVDLYFDKETGLLLKSEHIVKDDMSGQEVTEETVYEEYKEIQKTKQAMKFTSKRNGKLFLEGESTEIVLSEKLDASTFEKP